MKKIHALLLITLILIVMLGIYYAIEVGRPTVYPEVTPITYVQNESLVIFTPLRGAVVESPLSLTGKVRGTWLFEATAPVVLTNWDGLIIAEGYIEAQEDWMTEDFVPFNGTLTFDVPDDIGDFSDRGTIIFHKANPSGLMEYDDALEFDILFRPMQLEN